MVATKHGNFHRLSFWLLCLLHGTHCDCPFLEKPQGSLRFRQRVNMLLCRLACRVHLSFYLLFFFSAFPSGTFPEPSTFGFQPLLLLLLLLLLELTCEHECTPWSASMIIYLRERCGWCVLSLHAIIPPPVPRVWSPSATTHTHYRNPL